MPNGYWGSVIDAFQARREAEYLQNYQKDAANRQLADRVFSHLLASRDPEIQSRALRGLMTPLGTRKAGVAGFLGQTEDAASPLLEQIVARMNEMVPDEGPAPHATLPHPTPVPGASGSAAMSTNAPVSPGSAPIAQPSSYDFTGGVPEPDQQGPEAGLGPGGAPPAAAMGPPPPPPQSKFKRRGTGVPTAEEVAEANAVAQMRGKIDTALTELQGIGATPEMQQRAVMGLVGAPQNPRMLSTVTGWGVKVPGSDVVQPVLLDQEKGYTLPGGQPLPAGAEMVRMTGGAGGGAGLTTTIRDSPAVRAEYGIEPSEITPSGYWKIKQAADGSVMVMPAEYTPPPLYTGTTTIPDPTNPQVPVVAPILRGGGVGPALGDKPDAVKSKTQEDAETLIKVVDEDVALTMRSTIGRLSPPNRDALTAKHAAGLGLPYTTYDAALRAAKTTPPVTTRQKVTGGTMAERVRARALQNRTGAPTGPTKPQLPGRPTAEPTQVGP